MTAPAMTEVALSRRTVREQLRLADDGDVVTAFLAGEEQAFAELVDRYQTRLLNFVYRMIGDRDAAEDLAQEVFIRVYRHLHRFDPARRFATWIYTIAANLAKNELRNRARKRLLFFGAITNREWSEEPGAQFEDPSSRPDDLLHRRQLRALIAQATTRLTPRHREVFVLRDLEGRSYEEIAEITATNVGTVKSRLSRARSAFAEIVRPWIDDAPLVGPLGRRERLGDPRQDPSKGRRTVVQENRVARR